MICHAHKENLIIRDGKYLIVIRGGVITCDIRHCDLRHKYGYGLRNSRILYFTAVDLCDSCITGDVVVALINPKIRGGFRNLGNSPVPGQTVSTLGTGNVSLRGPCQWNGHG